MIENDGRYFNDKFPSIGNWLRIEIRSKEFQDETYLLDNRDTIAYHANRVELVVKTPPNNTSNAQSPEEDLFVCFYVLDNNESRSRAERLLSLIYPIYSTPKSV
jgi:hypothetical protein